MVIFVLNYQNKLLGFQFKKINYLKNQMKFLLFLHIMLLYFLHRNLLKMIKAQNPQNLIYQLFSECYFICLYPLLDILFFLLSKLGVWHSLLFMANILAYFIQKMKANSKYSLIFQEYALLYVPEKVLSNVVQ